VLELERLLPTDRRAGLPDDQVAQEQAVERRLDVLEIR